MGVDAVLRRTIVRAERWWDERDVDPGEPRLEAYLGHGGSSRAVIRGRVLGGPAPASAREGESVLAILGRTLASFTTRERAHLPVAVRLGDVEVATTTDDEGYLDVVVEPGLSPERGPWVSGEVEFDAPTDGPTDSPTDSAEPTVFAVEVRVPTAKAVFGVVSDVDDTVLVSGARRPLRMLRHTFTGSALTRRTFPGAAALYRALAEGADGPETNPVFYVSSSPWNLHGFLLAFLAHQRFPRGPLLLRDLLGTGRPRGHAADKERHITEILALHPHLPLLLIGDTGQDDAEIYAGLARSQPGRILGICLRDVGGGGRRLLDVELPVPVLASDDSAEMARWCASLGLLSADQVAAVSR